MSGTSCRAPLYNPILLLHSTLLTPHLEENFLFDGAYASLTHRLFGKLQSRSISKMAYYTHLSHPDTYDEIPPAIPFPSLIDLFEKVFLEGGLDNKTFHLLAHMLQMVIVKLAIKGPNTRDIAWLNPERHLDNLDYRLTPQCGLQFPSHMNRYLEWAYKFSSELATYYADEELSHYDLWTLFNHANEMNAIARMIGTWLVDCAWLNGYGGENGLVERLQLLLAQPRCIIQLKNGEFDVWFAHCQGPENHWFEETDGYPNPDIEEVEDLGLFNLSLELHRQEEVGRQPSKDEIRLVLEELVRIGNDTVEAFLAYGRITIDPRLPPKVQKFGPDDFAIICGNANILNFDLRISDPDSSIPLEMRRVLATKLVPHEFAAHLLKSALFPYTKFLQHARDGTAQFLAYQAIIKAFLRPEIDRNGSFAEVVDEFFDPVWKLNDPASFPKDFQPSFCHADVAWANEVFGENSGIPRAARTAPSGYNEEASEAEEEEEPVEYEPGELLDVELEAIGPEILPDSVGTRITPAEIQPADAMCVVCQEAFSLAPSMICFELTACSHVVHQECLHPWLNIVSVDPIRCPLCRAELCDPRPTRRKAD